MTNLAPHETLELRTLLGSEVLAAKKLKSTIPMVQDNELKTFMTDCYNSKISNIQTMTNFVIKQEV